MKNIDLQEIEPMALINHVQETTKQPQATQHDLIFSRLLEQFVPVDFEAIANPNNAENFKVTNKHYTVLLIEKIIETAENNRWGLCKNNNFIYLYNGTYWTATEKDAFEQFLGAAAEKMGVPIFTAKYFRFRDDLFKQFMVAAYLENKILANDKVLINLKNGTFEVTPHGTQLRPFNRLDFLTYQLPFSYDKEAKAPLFEAYLNKVLPDITRQKVLAEYLGYLFIKNGYSGLKLEKALILYGTGANGKSVFFEIASALLGDANTSNYSLQSLTEEKGYYRAKLANKIVNYASEINGKLESAVFKQLVSGEPVEARLPYGEPFTLRQYAKLIFNCNELPKDVEHTDAYFRRFLIVPFDVTIQDNEKDSQLANKIIEKELSGVFNWVLEGLNRLLHQKNFSECVAANKAVERYRLESDSVQLYLDEYNYCVCYDGSGTPLKEMYQEYRVYCVECGMQTCALRTFADRLRNLKYNVTKRNTGRIVNADKR